MGRTAEMILGILGGIFGILGGLFAITVGGLSAAFEVTGASEVVWLGTAAVILGVIGIIGGAIVNRNTKLAGCLMLFCGVVGFIAISAAWLIGGILLIMGGALSFLRSPEDEEDNFCPNCGTSENTNTTVLINKTVDKVILTICTIFAAIFIALGAVGILDRPNSVSFLSLTVGIVCAIIADHLWKRTNVRN